MNDAVQALDEIRVAELEAAQELERARSLAKDIVTAARREAVAAVDEAKQRGRTTARQRFEAAIAAAEEEAAAIMSGREVHEQALRHAAATRREAAVEAMVELMLSPPLEEGK